MNKFMMTGLALLVSSTTVAAADHAVLNVEGEIQINGKTIIDQEGNWTGNTSSPAVINVLEYLSPTVTKVELVSTVDSNMEHHMTYNPATGMSVKEETVSNGSVVWSMEWFEQTDTSNKVRTTSSYGEEVCTKEVLNTFAASTSYPSVPVGTLAARADVLDQEVTVDNCFPENVGTKTPIKDTMSMIVAAEMTYPFDGQNLECIYASQFLSWKNEYQNRVYCKGVGLVEMGEYKLKAIVQ